MSRTLLNGLGDVNRVTAVAVMKPHTKRNAPISTDPQAQNDLFEIAATIFTIAVGRTRPLVIHIVIIA